MPLLIGGAGEKVTAGIVARKAHEWKVWGTRELVVTDGHLGGDPARPRELLDVMAHGVVGLVR